MNDEHSRYDFEHYKNCQACYDEHLDFLDSLRQDEQDEVREMENACDE